MTQSYRQFVLALACALSCMVACQATTTTKQPAEDGFWKAVRTTAPKTAAIPKRSTGTLERHELQPFLDAGPSHILAQVPVTPVLDGDILVGYRVERFFENDARFATVDIEPGDIITAVNGARLETPDAFFAVWESLTSAPRLQIDVIRKTTMRTLTWEIVDQADADLASADPPLP